MAEATVQARVPAPPRMLPAERIISRLREAGHIGTRTRIRFPLVSRATTYVSLQEGAMTTSRSDGTVESTQSVVYLACFKAFESPQPRIRILLNGAQQTRSVTPEGACVSLILPQNVYEFQCEDAAKYQHWSRLLSLLGVPFVDPRSLYVHQAVAGKGYFSNVVLATYRTTGKMVALKVMEKSKVVYSDLYAEMKALRALDNPFIIKLYTAFETEETLTLVLEPLPGGQLYEYIESHGPLEEFVVRIVMGKVLLALAHMHARNFVHRDLKLENLLLEDGNNPMSVKVADFNLASSLDSPFMSMRCGSPGCVAPEILEGFPYGPKVDLFSAGVMMYGMLSGRHPFQAAAVEDVHMRNARCEYDFRHPYWNSISNEAKDLIAWMLQADPEDRCSAFEALHHPWIRVVKAAPPVPLSCSATVSTEVGSQRSLLSDNPSSEDLAGAGGEADPRTPTTLGGESARPRCPGATSESPLEPRVSTPSKSANLQREKLRRRHIGGEDNNNNAASKCTRGRDTEARGSKDQNGRRPVLNQISSKSIPVLRPGGLLSRLTADDASSFRDLEPTVSCSRSTVSVPVNFRMCTSHDFMIAVAKPRNNTRAAGAGASRLGRKIKSL